MPVAKSRSSTASGVTIEGAERLERKLSAFGPRVEKKLKRKAIRRAARIVLDETKAQAPVDEGDLEEGLKIRAMPRAARRKGVVGVAVIETDSDAFYDAFQEFGTIYIEPSGHHRGAADATRDQVVGRFRHEARKAIQETAKMEG